jgi:type II secretory pathway predicted ATPase ExeA
LAGNDCDDTDSPGSPDPQRPWLPRAVNNLALQALVGALAADKAIVDESSTRTAIAEVTAD